MNKDLPVIIHIPHSSTFIPPELRNEIIINDSSLQEELMRITDHYTDELFETTNFNYIINKYSRIVFDPERFRDDSKESMAQCGLGAIYEKTCNGMILRNISADRKEQLLKEFYDPYHVFLEEKVQELLDNHGRCLIIDAHSFPSTSDYYDANQSLPLICIGTDNYHTDWYLEKYAFEFFNKELQIDTKVNHPYSGSMVPMKFYAVDKRVSSIMLEVNRSIYMNELNGAKLPTFKSVQNMILKFLEHVSEFYVQNKF